MIKRSVVFSLDDMPGWGLKKCFGGSFGDGSMNYFQTHTGELVDVYVVDSGINFDHDEFALLKKNNRAFTLLDLTSDTDSTLHGTAVASIIAGNFLGVAPDVNLYSVRIFKNHFTEPENLLKALDAIEHHHIEKNKSRPSLVNLSFVMKRDSRIDQKVQAMTALGIIFVVAAGEQGLPVSNFSPAGLEEVITVAGLSKLSEFNAGVDSRTQVIVRNNYGPLIDIVAPADSITVAGPNQYKQSSGTSLACAYVTGVVACLLEAHPSADTSFIKQQLIASSQRGIQFKLNDKETCADRILFNPLQILKPRWDRTQSLLGVFNWGTDINIALRCKSRFGETLKFELIDGNLPDGLTFLPDGKIIGRLSNSQLQSDDEPSYYNLLVRAKDSSGIADRLLYFIATTQDKLEEMKISQGLIKLSNYPKAPCDRWCNTFNPIPHACCCFIAGTKIKTPTGLVNIESIEIGDLVLVQNGNSQKVVDFVEVKLDGRKLYAVNDGPAFFTEEHPFYSTQGEVAINVQEAERISKRSIMPMKKGIFLKKADGQDELITKIQSVSSDADRTVYNIIVDGDGSYIANNYVVSGKFVLGTASMPFLQQSKTQFELN